MDKIIFMIILFIVLLIVGGFAYILIRRKSPVKKKQAFDKMCFNITSYKKSIEIQKILFSMGYQWLITDNPITLYRHLSANYLFVGENGYIAYAQKYTDTSFKLMTIEELELLREVYLKLEEDENEIR